MGETGTQCPAAPLALWQLPRSGPNQLALPFPSDLVLTAQGNVDFSYFPGQSNIFVAQYTSDLAEKIHGYSTQGAAYFRFDAPLDPASFPTPDASRGADASIQLLDVDPASPERGRRVPVQTYFNTLRQIYWSPNTLAVAPVFGFPLRPSTRYAIVLTTALRSTCGALQRDADLEAVLGTGASTDAMVTSARTRLMPALTELATAGIPSSRILSFTVFTTQDPTAELFRAAEVLRTQTPVPNVLDAQPIDTPPTGLLGFAGHYGPNPIFQTGAQPYDQQGTGGFTTNAAGAPQPQGMQNFAFAFTYPSGEAPAGGWPIAVYAHGTGGDARSFINDGTAASLGAQGIAVLGFDQIFNGERTVPPGTPEVEFFNILNPLAGRTNNRQAALDLVSVGRMVRQGALTFGSTRVPLNANRVMFFGHSQGGLNGPLWLALEPTAGAAVLSGAGGTLSISITQKTQPVNIPQAFAALLQVTVTAANPLSPLHPVITMLQTAVDVSDPSNYARYIVREPVMGNRPHHVFQTQGFVDSYAPPAAIAALAMSIGLPLLQPILHPDDSYPLRMLDPVNAPVTANLGMPAVSAAWQQFNAPGRTDGHFVIFNVAAARNRAAQFLRTYAYSTDGSASIP